MTEEIAVSPMPPVINNRILRRIKLTEQQFESITLEDLIHNWREQDLFIDMLESQAASQEAEIASLREAEERMRQQHAESTHREKVLVRRLATKEQEMQEYASQIAEFKAAQTAGSSALRSALLDPAVNLVLQRLRGELLSVRTRLEETQNELSAWKFTPDSNTGKRLMAKCRLLYQENEELGRMISCGRLAKLEGELALQKSFSNEVKKSQSELDEFLQDLDEDVEGMQSTIYYLQQELRKSKEAYLNLQQQKNSQNSVVMNGYIIPNKVSLNMGKDPAQPVEVKSEPESYSSKPVSPLPRDETAPLAPADDVGNTLDEENGSEINELVSNVKSEPSGLNTEVNELGPDSLSENKTDEEEKTADLEESTSGYLETTEVVNEVPESGNNGEDETKEEIDDQDSQGELMIEVCSEQKDTEDEEESYEKTKVDEKLVVAPLSNIHELGRKIEVKNSKHKWRKKKAIPKVPKSESASPNSSDEDSDDTPLIKKVRCNHELLGKTKV